MSLLNQVLHDLDQRSAPGEGSPVRLATAPPVVDVAADPGGAQPMDVGRLVAWSLVALAALGAGVVFLGAPQGPRAPVPVIATLALPQPVPAAAQAVTAAVSPATAVATAPDHNAAPMADVTPPTDLSPAAAAATAAGSGSTEEVVLSTAATSPVAVAQAAPRTGPVSAAAPLRYLPLRNAVEPPEVTDTPARARRTDAVPVDVKTAVQTPADPLHAARVAIGGGELATAEVLLRQRLDRAPQDLEARELLLGLLLRGERTDAALQLLAEGLRRHPGHAAFVLIKARLLAEAGDDGAAVALLESAPRGQAVDVERLQMLAALYQQRARYDRAVETYRTLLARVPGSAAAWAGLALSLDGLGDAQAAAAYRRALQLGGLPRAAEAYARQRLAELGGGDG